MPGKISTFTAIITLTRLCLGPGLLVLPFATASGGLIFSPIGIFIVAAWNGLSCLMVIKCRHASLSQKSLDTKFNKDDNVLLLSTYSEVAYAGLGYFGVYLADFCVVVTLLGVCCAYQINFATLLAGISFLKDYHISISVFIVFSSLLVYPISLAKDLSVLASISLIGLICILVNCTTVLIYGVLLYSHDHNADISDTNIIEQTSYDIPMFPSSYGNMASYFGVAVFCFGICAFIFPIEETMQNQSEFAGAVFYSLCLVCVVYILVGDGSAFLYNDVTSGHISSNILLNLPVDSIAATIARLSMAAVCILTYPLTLLPPATMIEKMITFYNNKGKEASIDATISAFYVRNTDDKVVNGNIYASQGTTDATTSLLANRSTMSSYQSHADTPINSNDNNNSSSHKQQQHHQPVPLSYTDFSEVIVETLPFTPESVIYNTISTNKSNRLCFQVGDNNKDVIDDSDVLISSQENAVVEGGGGVVLSWQLKALIRLILVVISTVSAGYVPCFGAVVSLLGCFTLSILSFVLPPLLHFRLVTLPALQKLNLSLTNRSSSSRSIILPKGSRNASKSRLSSSGSGSTKKKRRSQKVALQLSGDSSTLSSAIKNNVVGNQEQDQEAGKGFQDDDDDDDDDDDNAEEEDGDDNDYNNDDDIESRISDESHETVISHESYVSPRYESKKIKISSTIGSIGTTIQQQQQQQQQPNSLIKQLPSVTSVEDDNVLQNQLQRPIREQPEPWLPPKVQAVVDMILIIAGLIISIVGTVITFNQIRSSTAQC